MKVSRKYTVQGQRVLKTENHNQTKNDDPQIPQPDLRFARGTAKQTAENRTKPKKTGPEPKQKPFFPSDAFVASARSFNMFKSMLQLGLID